MKKLFLLMALFGTTAGSMAKDYQDRLQVFVNGEASSQQATISVDDEGNDTYTLSLKNFVLVSGNTQMGVGNITLEHIAGTTADGKTTIHASQDITISEGNKEGIDLWMGPILGPIPVELTAELSDDKLYTIIDIDLSSTMGQIIKVIFGTGGYQLPNADFELFHTVADSYVEPNGWHSFESASGSLAALAGHHLDKSDDVRPGTCGKQSVRLYSTSIFGIIANGTMTTGRMNAAAMKADDPQNNAYLDMSLTDTDANGDPYYARMNSLPDSLVMWVKFTQGTANSEHPYATVSAVITDGTYFQDPQDKTYTNIVGQASNHEIASRGGQWQRLSIPFVYTGSSLSPKAILVTLSTNADPGQGSNGDELLIDDMSLIYNAQLASLSVKGASVSNFDKDTYEYTLTSSGTLSVNDIVATPTGAAATVNVALSDEGGNTAKAVITVTAGDLASKKQYTVIVNNVITESIATIGNSTTTVSAYYSLSGQRTVSPRPGSVYIQKHSDGTARKVIRQ
jgi:hypothetical protein